VGHSPRSNNLPSASPIIKERTIPSQCHRIHKQQSIIQRNKLPLSSPPHLSYLEVHQLYKRPNLPIIEQGRRTSISFFAAREGGLLSSIQFRFNFCQRFSLHETLCRKKYRNIRRRKHKLIKTNSRQHFRIRISNRHIPFQYPIPKPLTPRITQREYQVTISGPATIPPNAANRTVRP
jgi:hypothetical protein